MSDRRVPRDPQAGPAPEATPPADLDMPLDGSLVGFRHNPERAHPCDFGCGGTWVCTGCGWESTDDHAAARHACASAPVLTGTAPPTLTRELIRDAWHAIVTHGCGHPLVCADKKCRAAEHDHESYGEDGRSCEHEDCECAPACKGFEPETCPATTKKRETAARLTEAIAAAPAPAISPRADWHKPDCVSAPYCGCAAEEIARLRAEIERAKPAPLSGDPGAPDLGRKDTP